MTLSTGAYVAAIATHSSGFADAARGNLDARVEHCPDWSVGDLVRHLTDVHWFWGTIVEELLEQPPAEDRRPTPATDAEAVDAFERGAERLTRVLGEAEQAAHCWTWAGWQQDVAFVTRHQVQEAAVHHWDAAHAAGRSWVIDPALAADCVDEFVVFSVASDQDPDDPTDAALAGTLVLRATDTGDAWTMTDGDRPGNVHVDRGVTDPDAPVLEASAADLLLWLYDRVELDTSAVPGQLLARYRALRFTD